MSVISISFIRTLSLDYSSVKRLALFSSQSMISIRLFIIIIYVITKLLQPFAIFLIPEEITFNSLRDISNIRSGMCVYIL